jgi:hypothetical protein
MNSMAQPLATHLPPRNRRRGRRIITLKNFWRLLLAGIVLFVVLTVASNLKKSTPGQYGSLYGKQQPVAAKAAFHPAIVTEAPTPVSEQERADALRLDAAAKSQYLGTDNKACAAPIASPSVPAGAPATTSFASNVDNSSFGPPPAVAPLRRGQKVSIVGDSDGVKVVKQ